MKSSIDKNLLEAAGTIFKNKGYAGTHMDLIAVEASMDPIELDEKVGGKETLCTAWLSDIHQRSEDRHKKILASDASPLQKIETYFEHLKTWMLEYNFEGCPFTHVANSMGQEQSDSIRNEIKMHKHFVCDFFVELSNAFTATEKDAETLGRSLFLLYSAATTEAKNLYEIWPIEHAAQLAQETCLNAQKNNLIHASNA